MQQGQDPIEEDNQDQQMQQIRSAIPVEGDTNLRLGQARRDELRDLLLEALS